MIYLASNSPRRAELLRQIAVQFTVVNAPIEEKLQVGETPDSYALRLAREKASAGFACSNKDRPVLGADTIVVIAENILEKPRNKAHAREMLKLLSGCTHQVLTAIALVDANGLKTKLVKTEVGFKVLSEQEIADYWMTGEPLDKAGGYAIQGVAGKFITHISGSYSAVVGLPLHETDQLIKEFYRN
ncbi:Maf family protein [Psychromonas antarctica]|uniref:Maf family protein n=1 Tax=Psychromonas antarctica TaxID=67573 RepID=UPI001EE7CDD8|nr:Maf family protein [Psychromonas antarctica]MCG6200340.1 Maf-like protein [Psychromonas antarctica]